jgi:putative ABC transport system permease protein
VIRAGIRRAFRLALRRRDRWEREVEEEIKLHLSLRAEQLVAHGATPDDAYREAVRKFGPLAESHALLLEAARHRESHMQRIEHLSDLRQDLAFAFRTLRRDRGWTALTTVTLALGIAATTAVFSVVSRVLLHAVAYPGADRVVVVFQQPTTGNNTGVNVAITPNSQIVRAWKESAHGFEALEALAAGQADLRTTSGPVTLNVTEMEPTFPRFAGVQPIVGRVFTAAEVSGHDHVALLGEGLWRERFGADRSILGKPIMLDDSSYTIVGVLPAKLQTPRVGAPPTDVWLPLDLRRENIGAAVVGRLAPGTDPDRAARELDSAYARSTTTGSGPIPFRAVVTTPARRVNFRDSLIMLGAAVGLVLLVACANVAHLLLARSTGRRRELAIRIALGAGRGRVFRQLLTESLLLATFGGTLGVAGGWAALKVIVALRPPALSALEVAHVDGTTLALALAVTLTTSVVFGVMGAAQSARTSTHDQLKSGGVHSAVTGHGRVRHVLVVTEMALSATLAVGAAMLVRSVINMQNADLGFEPKGLYVLSLSSSKGHFANGAAKGELVRSVATRLATVSGVRSVTLASSPPSWFSFLIGRVEIDGEPVPTGPATAFVSDNQVGSTYFRTMGIRLVQGTPFTDTTRAANQVIINERFARKQWRGASPLGKRLRVAQGGKEPWLTVVGVAADAQTGGPMVTESSAPFLYLPAADSNAVAIMLRTDGTSELARPIQALVQSLDGQVTPKLESVEVQLVKSIAAPRFVMLLLTTFTVLALALAAIGLYGVMAYSVAQRTREIGIRVALGATRGRIARAVVTKGASLALAGSAVGVTIALWGTKLIEHELYGVAKRDTVSLGASVIVLIAVGVLACVVPARRALAVDPMTAIRAD